MDSERAPSLLIVTAKVENAKILAKALARIPRAAIAVAASNKEAVRRLTETPTDLVVADCTSGPGGSAGTVQLHRALRESKHFRGLPFLALGRSGDQILAQALLGDVRSLVLPLTTSAADLCDAATGLMGSGFPAAEDGIRHALTRYLEGDLGAARKALEDAALQHGRQPSLFLAQALVLLALGEHPASEQAVSAYLNPGSDTPTGLPTAGKAAGTSAQPGPACEAPSIAPGWGGLDDDARRRKAQEHHTPSHDGREAYRTFAPDWSVRLCGSPTPLQVVNVSQTGIGFEKYTPAPDQGGILRIDILRDGAPLLREVSVRVARVGDETIGACFPSLDRSQERILNQAIMEAQKRLRLEADEQAGKKTVITLPF